MKPPEHLVRTAHSVAAYALHEAAARRIQGARGLEDMVEELDEVVGSIEELAA